MKKLIPAALMAAILFSCNSNEDKGKFTLTGELKSMTDLFGKTEKKFYLEELYFSEKPPAVLDTVEIVNGKFSVTASATEEGLYRLRTETGADSYLFINDADKISFTGVVDEQKLSAHTFSGPANSSLRKLLEYSDSIGVLIANKNRLLSEFSKAGITESDSTFKSISDEFNALSESFTSYCFKYADTSKSPVVSLFAATMPPVGLSEFQAPLTKLTTRFPKHKGIADALAYVKKEAAKQTQPQPTSGAAIGDMAPEITMNDVNDKPFTLSQLKGKYVLIDFWASWCAPCREENPNVVAAYNKFKDKNFTILGVSFDKEKDDWMSAIKKDNLTWQQVSDLKYMNSTAVQSYGISGIPYNVLIDPQGKIIATGLRGNELHSKLAEVLK